MQGSHEVRFVVNTKKIVSNYKRYRELGSVYYPLKTNTNEIVLNTLKNNFREDKDGFLISNLEHFKILKSMHILSKNICLMNVLTSRENVKYLYENGVRFFVFEEVDSLQYFLTYANVETCKIAIRLNIMEVFDDIDTHLGASKDEIVEMLELLSGKCRNVGISFYLQKKVQNNDEALKKVLRYIKNEFSLYHLSFVSMAGLKKYDEISLKELEQFKRSLNLAEIILEPGKFLVGDTVDLKTKIIRNKTIKDKRMLVIQNGIFSGMLDVVLYDEIFNLYLDLGSKLIPFKYEKDEVSNYEVYVCGGSSDSRDVIGTMYIDEKYKDKLKVGAAIKILDVGSYFEVFLMNYGGDINRKIVEV